LWERGLVENDRAAIGRNSRQTDILCAQANVPLTPVLVTQAAIEVGIAMTIVRKCIIVIALAGLTSCGRADVGKPDSSNPAHCIAALNWGRNLELRGQPNMHGALSLTAREVFEIGKLEKAGVQDKGQSAATAFTLKYGKDSSIMQPLVVACMKREDQEPSFKAMSDSGQLMEIARKVDPICKADAECASGKKW
jgi:hypothetical protein